jgi:hypothetical protein
MTKFLSVFSIALLATSCGDNSHLDQIETLEETITMLEADLMAAETERDVLAARVADLETKAFPTVTLEVPLMYGSSALALATPYPVGATGDTISFREVRYWMSNISLRKADGTFVDVPDTYFLIEARPEQPLTNGTEAAITLAANRRETLTLKGIPAGTYNGIRFHVGVDQTRNDDLSNTAGELHTLKNMTFHSWMWFTSYIFTKTRADLTGAGGPDAIVVWDNGSNADYREVTLAFGSPLAMGPGKAYAVKATADLAKVVTTVQPRTRTVIDAAADADRAVLADAFRDMFTMVSASAAQ